MNRRWPIRAQMSMLALALAIPLVGLLAYTIYFDASHDAKQAGAEVLGLAHITAKHAEGCFSETQGLLERLAQRPLVRALEPARCEPLLADFLALHPEFTNVLTIDVAGRVVCSGLVHGKEKFTAIADTPWFKQIVRDARFVVSGPMIGPVTGKWVSMQAYPLHDDQGALRGVVAVTADLASYAPPLGEAALRSGIVSGIVDGNATIVTRLPDPTKWVGKNVHDAEIMKVVLSSKEGPSEAVGSDGVKRIYGFTAIAGSDWYAIAGIPAQVVYAPVRKLLIQNILIALAIIVAVTGVAWFLSRRITEPIRGIAEAANAVAQGRTDTRASVDGPAEIVEVAAQFNRMLDSMKEAEDTLRKSEVRFRATFNQAAVGIAHLAPDGRWLRINDKFCAMVGYSRDELLGRTFHEITHPDDRPDGLGHLESLWTGDTATLSMEKRYIRKDGSVIWVHVTISPVRETGDEPGYFVAVSEDITLRKEVDEALRSTNERLQALSHRLLEVQESERRHIARELHDEIGQALTAMQIHLQTVLGMPGTAALASRLEECIEITERTLEQVRNLSRDLRPPHLDHLGLVATVRWHLDRQARAAGLASHFSADSLSARLAPELEIACFRVAQEALTNVVRHADARQVTVELRQEEGELHLWVRDDGKGFDPEAARGQALAGASMGLASMQERATLAGGRLELDSAPCRGTEVHGIFPLIFVP